MTKRPALRPDLPLDETLKAVAADILDRARNAITDGTAPTDDAIHDFRKAIKRWRSFLRLLEPHFGDGADNLRAAARDAAKKLGGARDLRSAFDASEDLREHSHELNDRALETIQKRIRDLQLAAEATTIDGVLRAEIAREISRWLTTVSLWPFSGIRFQEISKALAAGYRRARRAMPDDWTAVDEEALHEFRRRVIDHRYQMELVEPMWPRLTKIWVDEAQRLRDELGQHRDLTLLLSMAAPRQPLARFRSKLTPAVARRQEQHAARAAKIAARVFSEKPRAFQARMDTLWLAGADD